MVFDRFTRLAPETPGTLGGQWGRLDDVTRWLRPAALDLRLVWPAAAGWTSAAVLVAVPASAAVVSGMLWAAAVVLVSGAAWASRVSRPERARTARRSGALLASLAICCAAAALSATAIAVQAPTRLPDAVRTIIDGPEGRDEVTAHLTVGSAPVPRGGAVFGGAAQVRFRATLTALDGPPGREPSGLSVPIVVFAAASDPGPAIGDEVRVAGSLVATEPGDAASALLFGRGPVHPVSPAPWWLDWANDLRAGFADAAGELPGDGAGLLPGLAIGDTSAVADDLDGSMKTSSLSHLTAVSGDPAPNRGETQIGQQARATGPMVLGRLDQTRRPSRSRPASYARQYRRSASRHCLRFSTWGRT